MQACMVCLHVCVWMGELCNNYNNIDVDGIKNNFEECVRIKAIAEELVSELDGQHAFNSNACFHLELSYHLLAIFKYSNGYSLPVLPPCSLVHCSCSNLPMDPGLWFSASVPPSSPVQLSRIETESHIFCDYT